MARIIQQGSIRTTGVSIENEPIIKSDGSGEIMQWQPSDGGTDGIYITEGGSAGDPARLGIGVSPTVPLDVSGNVKISSMDTSDMLVITNADGGTANAPDLVLYRNSPSPADNDKLGLIQFRGENSADSLINYANIEAVVTDVTDGTEDSKLVFKTYVAGAETTALTLDGTSVDFGAGDFAVGGAITVSANDPQLILSDSAGTNKLVELRSNDGAVELVSRDNAANGAFKFIGEAGSTETTQMEISAAGNVGVAKTPSANQAIAYGPSVQVGQAAALIGAAGGNNLFLSNNALFNNSNWLLTNAGQASQMFFNTDGSLTYRQERSSGSAGGTISWDDALTISSAGAVSVTNGNMTVKKSTGVGNTTLKVENDSAGNAAVLELEGKRTGDNDSSQIQFSNSGEIISAIKAFRSGANDAGKLELSTSASGSSGLTSRMSISSTGVVSFGNSSTNEIIVGFESSTQDFGIGANGSNFMIGTNATDLDAGNLVTISAAGAVTIPSGTVTIGSLDIGHGAGGAATNTAVGKDALASSPASATRNTAIGYEALNDVNNATGDYNVAVGSYAGDAITTGYSNTAVGDASLSGTDDGIQNVAVGQGALSGNCSNSNTAVGVTALAVFTGSDAVAVGFQAADAATTAVALTAVGTAAGSALVDQPHNTFLGYASGNATTGGSNTFVGSNSGLYATTTDDCVAIGRNALLGASGNTTGNHNVAIGSYSLDAATTATNNIAIGYNSGSAITSGASNVSLGFHSLRLEDAGTGNVAIGRSALENQNVDTGRNTAIGFDAAKNLTTATDGVYIGYAAVGNGTATASHNIVIGKSAGYDLTSGAYNVLLGTDAGTNFTDNVANIAIGFGTLDAADAGEHYNIAIGHQALTTENSGADGCIAIGYNALQDQNVASANNTAIGYGAAQELTSGTDNTFLGYFAGANGIITGVNNVVLGGRAAFDLTSGHSNVIIGKNAAQNFTANNSNVVIGNDAMESADAGEHYNIAIGDSALQLMNQPNGDGNVAIGHNAFQDLNTSNAQSVAVGYQAGLNATTSTQSTYVGYESGGSGVITGNRNTCLGYSSGKVLTGAQYNTFVGALAGDAATTGGENTAVGDNAFGACDDGTQNTAVGKSALTANCGDSNTALGFTALQNFTGGHTTAVGSGAAQSLTTATGCTAIGREALNANATNDGHTAVGYKALELATGGDNTAVGSQTLSNVTSGANNTALGRYALYSANGSESYNTALGRTALYSIDNNSAQHNIGIGYDAGRFHETTASATPGSGTPDGDNTSSVNSIFIGNDTRSASAGDTNSIVIGYQAVSNGDNRITLGNDDTGAIHCAESSISGLSDRRIKRDIVDNNVGLEFIEKLTTINYKKLNPADWPEEIRSHQYRVEEHQELVISEVKAQPAVWEEAVEEVVQVIEHPAIEEITEEQVIPAVEEVVETTVIPAVEEVTETIVYPAVEAVYEDVVIPAVAEETEERVTQEAQDEIIGQRQKYTEEEISEEVTRTEIVEEDGKWVRKEITETETHTERTYIFEDCDLYDEDGTLCTRCVTPAKEAVTEEQQVLDENGDGVVNEDGTPLMETVVIEEAVAEVRAPEIHRVPVMEDYVQQEAKEEVVETFVIQAAEPERTEQRLVSPAEEERTETRVVVEAAPERTETRIVQEAQEERTETVVIKKAKEAWTETKVITPASERRLISPAIEAKEAVYETVTVPADERPEDNDTNYVGLIAQDVQTAMTDAGVDFDLVTEGANGKLAVKYSNLVIPLLKAVQELSAEVKALKNG